MILMGAEYSHTEHLTNFPVPQSLTLYVGDISKAVADVIVNAANERLILGSGVAGAIRKKGGPSIQNECDKIGYTPVGQIAVTSAGNLDARYIFHAVGPIFSEYTPERADELLRSTIFESLVELEKRKLHTITFPAISTGIFGFPRSQAAITMLQEILRFFSTNMNSYHVRICLFTKEDWKIFFKELQKQTSSLNS